MKIVMLALVALASAVQAASPAEKKVLLDSVILYDGTQTGVPARWIRKETPGYYGHDTDAISCAHLIVRSGKEYPWFSLDYHSSYSCSYAIAGLDFGARALLVLVDLQQTVSVASQPVVDSRGYLVATAPKVRSYPYARYLAALSGTPTDFFSGAFAKPEKVTSSLDSLADVMNHLSRTQENLGQNRYVDGKLTFKAKGEMKFDPHSLGLKFPNLDRVPKLLFELKDKDQELSFSLTGTASDVRNYPKPTEVYGSLTKTMEILWEGYEKLEAASDEEAKALFKELISKNSETISTELQTAIRLMREKGYHPLELLHFVNQVGDLVASIDRILQSKEGSGPGFFETLNGRRSRRGN